MNKIVEVYSNESVLKVVKIDSDTQKEIGKGSNKFVIAGGLQGVFDYENQYVTVQLPNINFMLEKDFKSYKDTSVNLMLNGVQTKKVLKGETIKTSFADIENVVFEISYNSETKAFKFSTDMGTMALPYYTENNIRIAKK